MTSQAPLRLVFTLFVIVLTLAASPLRAQEPLTQTAILTANGVTLSLLYPESWVATTPEEGIFLASSADAMEAMTSGREINSPGSIGIIAYLPDFLDNFDLPHDAPASEVVSAYLQSAGFDGEVHTSTDFTVPAATAVISPPGHSEYLVGALEFPGGTVVFGITPDSAVDQTVLEVINSIELSGSSNVQAGDTDTTVLSVQQTNGIFDLAFTLPEGWVWEYSESGGVLYVANTESALEKVSISHVELEAGEVALSIAFPDTLANLNLPRTSPPDEAIMAIIERFRMQGTVQMDESFGVPAAFTTITDESESRRSGDVYALAFDAGTLLIHIQHGSPVEDVILEFLYSLQFGDLHSTQGTNEIRQWAVRAEGSSEYAKDDWSFVQATGAPDTEECGDYPTAWASATPGREFLVVHFEQPVVPTQINVYQTFNPGSIEMIDVGNSDNPDRVLPLPNSADLPGNTDCPGIFTLNISGVDAPIDFVVIYLDQSIDGDWNEIDAVELVGTSPE